LRTIGSALDFTVVFVADKMPQSGAHHDEDDQFDQREAGMTMVAIHAHTPSPLRW